MCQVRRHSGCANAQRLAVGMTHQPLVGFIGVRTGEIYGGLGIDYELADNLLLTTDGVYSAVSYDPASGFGERRDDIWRGSAGLIFLVNEYFQLRADYTYTTRSSNVPGQDFDDNTFLLTLRSQL